jgi:hypothetical protein
MVSQPLAQFRKASYTGLAGMAVQLIDASSSPFTVIIPGHLGDDKGVAPRTTSVSGMEVMEKEFGLLPGLQNVMRWGPGP